MNRFSRPELVTTETELKAMAAPAMAGGPAGSVFLWYVLLYSVGRFTLEFVRGDSLTMALGLKTAQVSSVLAAAIAAYFLYRRGRHRQPPDLSPAP